MRPYGWPDEEVLLLVARLLVLGEISLMMDGALVPLDKAYEAITTPAKRRKITIRQAADDRPQGDPERPQPGQGTVLRDGAGRRGRPVHLPAGQAQGLADCLARLQAPGRHRQLPRQGRDRRRPGAGQELLGVSDSYKFIEQFNAPEERPARPGRAASTTWNTSTSTRSRPGRSSARRRERFELNRLELEQDAQAGPALKRMHEILAAPSPYGLIKEAEGLDHDGRTASTPPWSPGAAQQAARQDRRPHRHAHGGHRAAKGDAGLRTACLRPLETLKAPGPAARRAWPTSPRPRPRPSEEFDAAIARIEEFVRRAAEKPVVKGTAGHHEARPGGQEAAGHQAGRHGEDAVPGDEGRRGRLPRRAARELEKAIASNERIQIR